MRSSILNRIPHHLFHTTSSAKSVPQASKAYMKARLYNRKYPNLRRAWCKQRISIASPTFLSPLAVCHAALSEQIALTPTDANNSACRLVPVSERDNFPDNLRTGYGPLGGYGPMARKMRPGWEFLSCNKLSCKDASRQLVTERPCHATATSTRHNSFVNCKGCGFRQSWC